MPAAVSQPQTVQYMDFTSANSAMSPEHARFPPKPHNAVQNAGFPPKSNNTLPLPAFPSFYNAPSPMRPHGQPGPRFPPPNLGAIPPRMLQAQNINLNKPTPHLNV